MTTVPAPGAPGVPADAASGFEAMFASALDGIVGLQSVRDAQGVIEDFVVRHVNAQGARIAGQPAEALVGQRLLDLFPGHRELGFLDLYRHVVETGTPAEREMPYEADGVSVCLHLSCVPLGDGLFVTFRDVTAHRHLREQEARTQELLQQVLASSLDGIVVLEAVRDAQGEVVDFLYRLSNAQAEAMTPDRSAGRVGRRYLELYPKAREDGLFGRYVQVIETGQPVQFETQDSGDGERRHFRLSVVRLGDGVAVTIHDVTAAVAREAALRESEERFRVLAESSLDIVTQVAPDGTPVYISPALTRVLGYAPEELLGRDTSFLIHPDDLKAMAEAAEAREGPAPTEGTIEYRVRHKDGHYVWVETSGRVLFDDDGEPVGSVVAARDVSERKEAERALRSRNRELQEFAYVASHDLQEPLRKIRAYADLLLADFRDTMPEEAQAYLDRMQASAARMSGFIRDLLALSRVATRGGEFVPVDPNGVLRDVLSDLEVSIRESGADVMAAPLPSLRADPVQLRQLFQNLVGNALKFHRPGVVPCVEVRGRVEGDGAADACVVFEVCDNGIGFEERYLDRIFTPFQRLHTRERYEGSGVGLAICRRIAERHGGSLTARSSPGIGSTFVVTFPRIPLERNPSEFSLSSP